MRALPAPRVRSRTLGCARSRAHGRLRLGRPAAASVDARCARARCARPPTAAGSYTPVMAKRDPRAVLGVEPDASPTQIKAAWRRLARTNHPDLTGDDPAASRVATRRMAEINDAYAALTREIDRAGRSGRGSDADGTPVRDGWQRAQCADRQARERLKPALTQCVQIWSAVRIRCVCASLADERAGFWRRQRREVFGRRRAGGDCADLRRRERRLPGYHELDMIGEGAVLRLIEERA